MVKHQFGGFYALVAQLVKGAGRAQARRAFFDQEEAHAAIGRRASNIRACKHREETSAHPVRYPELAAGENVVLARTLGGHGNRLHIAAAAGLGEAERAAQFPGGHAREETLPLLLRTIGRDHIRHQNVRVDNARQAHPAARKLLDDARVGAEVEGQANIGFGQRGAKDAQVLELLHQGIRVEIGVLQGASDRKDLPLDKAPHLVNKSLLLILQWLRHSAHTPLLSREERSLYEAGMPETVTSVLRLNRRSAC